MRLRLRRNRARPVPSRLGKPTESGIEVAYRGPNAEQVSIGEDNLIIMSMQRAAADLKTKLPSGVRLEVENQIPLGVGLGSSAAAIVAGIALGAALCGADLTRAPRCGWPRRSKAIRTT